MDLDARGWFISPAMLHSGFWELMLGLRLVGPPPHPPTHPLLSFPSPAFLLAMQFKNDGRARRFFGKLGHGTCLPFAKVEFWGRKNQLGCLGRLSGLL